MQRWFRDKSEIAISGLIFISTFLIFLLSPVRTLGENEYSMVLSQCLVRQGSFALDARLFPDHLERYGETAKVKGYPVELVGGRVYFYAPPGGSVLSAPYVLLMNAFGLKATDASGKYDPRGELQISAGLAALLMAGLAVIFFHTARLMLPSSLSIIVALTGTLGTQVWSTASRVVEQDTWSIFLLGIVIHSLLAQEVRGRRASPIWLASLLAWTYFVRPTNSLSIIAISVYLFIYYRRSFLAYAATGVAWLALLVIYSWHNFGQLLPNYYRASRLDFGLFWTALAGNLISPGRGLLIYVPALFFVAYLLARNWHHVPGKRLVLVALCVIVSHLLAVSGFTHWWAGHSYGPRYSTGLVPWLVLLAILSLKGMLRAHETPGAHLSSWSWNRQLLCGAVFAVLGMLINARGALSLETRWWNARPADVDEHPERLWDWSYPQFLAGLVQPPLPNGSFPLIESDTRLDMTTREADKFLWYGWSGPEPEFRWSDGKEATVIFGLKEIVNVSCRMKLRPFLYGGKVDEQLVSFDLNGQPLTSVRLGEAVWTEVSLNLPRERLRQHNVLTCHLPEAASMEALKLSSDPRLLGISVQWIQFHLRRDELQSQRDESQRLRDEFERQRDEQTGARG
jgi:hypothetical protein